MRKEKEEKEVTVDDVKEAGKKEVPALGISIVACVLHFAIDIVKDVLTDAVRQ